MSVFNYFWIKFNKFKSQMDKVNTSKEKKSNIQNNGISLLIRLILNKIEKSIRHYVKDLTKGIQKCKKDLLTSKNVAYYAKDHNNFNSKCCI